GRVRQVWIAAGAERGGNGDEISLVPAGVFDDFFSDPTVQSAKLSERIGGIYFGEKFIQSCLAPIGGLFVALVEDAESFQLRFCLARDRNRYAEHLLRISRPIRA